MVSLPILLMTSSSGIFGGHGNAVLSALLVDALQFYGQVADLLGLVLSGDGEFDVVAFTETAELIDFIVIARNEGAHFAASHLEIFAGSVEVGTNAADFGVHILQII